MNNLYKIEGIVMETLMEFPDTRLNDDILIFRVYKKINEEVVLRELFLEIMLNRKQYGLPSYKSIERARRKIFEKYPVLKPKRVTKLRKEMEHKYIEYASNS